MAASNRRIVLAARPHGEPQAAHFRVEEARMPIPKPGETVVVAAAAGPVGCLVGQIARLHAARAGGLENAPEAFIGLLQGRNFGNLVVRVSEPALAGH